MSSLRDIRKRIRSIKSSQKITKAMKMVAASKLRRAQDAIQQARPYAEEIGLLMQRLAAAVLAAQPPAADGSSSGDADSADPAAAAEATAADLAAAEAAAHVHPLLALRPPRRVLLVVITSDRGSCGAFNSNLLRRAERFAWENRQRFSYLEVATIGRKGREYYAKRRGQPARDYPAVLAPLSFRRVSEVAQGIVDEYEAQKLDAVFLLYNEFKSVISQKVVVRDVLPVLVEPLAAAGGDAAAADGDSEYLYEPSPTAVLDRLIPRYVATQLWRALLESTAAEHGARMTAMDAATRNARDLIDQYTLQYNRARQAAITRDLMDIVGGAEALNG